MASRWGDENPEGSGKSPKGEQTVLSPAGILFYAHIWTAEKEEAGNETPHWSDLLTIMGDSRTG